MQALNGRDVDWLDIADVVADGELTKDDCFAGMDAPNVIYDKKTGMAFTVVCTHDVATDSSEAVAETLDQYEPGEL